MPSVFPAHSFIEAEGLEKTYKFTQADILENVTPEARKKASASETDQQFCPSGST